MPSKPTAAKIKPGKRKAAVSSGIAAPSETGFPIVGVGCSAGGLDALEHFFRGVHADCGMAFVVVQHLDPAHASLLPELLRRISPMRVTEIENGMAVTANCVYVIPPNKDLAIHRSVLSLLDPAAPRGLRLPIDFFLRALADDQKEKAIGVILSGMGSDGVLGLGAIKERSGLTLVQDPDTAQADGMPRSAIEADVVDIVASAEQLVPKILAYVGNPVQPLRNEPVPDAHALSTLDRIVSLLFDRSGNDFSLYKTTTLYRRIERRIALHGIDSIFGYVQYLAGNPHELDLLFKELLIGVTSFFRDPAVWTFLRNEALPALIARYPSGKIFRAWVPACSSGEEAYSLAMVFRETLDQISTTARFSLQIYATDLDQDAIEKARKGSYPANIEADVSSERLARHFIKDEERYRICSEIRQMVVFAPQNVIADPPFTQLDILSCRNLLIYFGQPLQKKLLPLFHYALSREGLLILGSAESVGSFGELFVPVEAKLRIFARVDHAVPLSDLTFQARTVGNVSPSVRALRAEPVDDIGQLADQLIQQKFAPAAVLVNADGDILYISGRTGKYLEPAAGRVNMNIHVMAREGLAEALPGVIHKALRSREAIHINDLRIGDGAHAQSVNLTVCAIEKPEALCGRVIIVFNDVATPRVRRKTVDAMGSSAEDALKRELLRVRETLQVTREEMQTSTEELRSSNEELQSTNEELQSTNEELITSKEELQSLNEELQTVNAELQSKIDDLTWVRNDMANLLNSTEIITIFLDNQMNLRRFTSRATSLFKLIPGDIGRPLSDITTEIVYPELIADARKVLHTLVFDEKLVSARDGRQYRSRIMPYRTQENVIDGVVITFIDISEIVLLIAGHARG